MNEMKAHKVLWLGSYQSAQMFMNMKAKVFGEASGYTSQKGIISGIDESLNENIVMDTIACSIAFPAYPKYPDLYVPKQEWSRTGKSYDTTIKYLNIKYIKYISRYCSLMREIKRWNKNRSAENNTVIIYEPSYEKLLAAKYLKKKCNTSVYLIVPDIPELVNTNNKVLQILKSVASKKSHNIFAYVDGFILYSKCMSDYYQISDDKWIVMEGVFDPSEAEIMKPIENKIDSDHIRIMYSGAVEPYRGIPQLLDAFSRLKGDNYELLITGEGTCDQLVRTIAEKDKRIHHYGFLADRTDVLKLQQSADVLIHTRDIDAPSAPYCFPSKLFEYLASGKVVISVVLPGIPEEYYKYMLPIREMSSDSILFSIQTALKLSNEERKAFGDAGREFVIRYKNSRVQAEKMLRFMSLNKVE